MGHMWRKSHLEELVIRSKRSNTANAVPQWSTYGKDAHKKSQKQKENLHFFEKQRIRKVTPVSVFAAIFYFVFSKGKLTELRY